MSIKLRLLAAMTAVMGMLGMVGWFAVNGGVSQASVKPKTLQAPPTAAQARHTPARRARGALPSLGGRRASAKASRWPEAARNLVHTHAKRRMLIDVGAIQNSEIGRMVVDCISQEDPDGMEEMREKTGIDLFQAVKHVAISGDDLALMGDFTGADFDGLFPATSRRKYSGAEIFETDYSVSAVWRDKALLHAKDSAGMEALIDRLEGNGPELDEPVRPLTGAGVAVGQFPAEDLLEVVPVAGETRSAIAQALGVDQFAMRFRVDADESLGITVGLPPLYDRVLEWVVEASAEGAVAHEPDFFSQILSGTEVVRGRGGSALKVGITQSQLRQVMGCKPRVQ